MTKNIVNLKTIKERDSELTSRLELVTIHIFQNFVLNICF